MFINICIIFADRQRPQISFHGHGDVLQEAPSSAFAHGDSTWSPVSYVPADGSPASASSSSFPSQSMPEEAALLPEIHTSTARASSGLLLVSFR